VGGARRRNRAGVTGISNSEFSYEGNSEGAVCVSFMIFFTISLWIMIMSTLVHSATLHIQNMSEMIEFNYANWVHDF